MHVSSKPLIHIKLKGFELQSSRSNFEIYVSVTMEISLEKHAKFKCYFGFQRL